MLFANYSKVRWIRYWFDLFFIIYINFNECLCNCRCIKILCYKFIVDIKLSNTFQKLYSKSKKNEEYCFVPIINSQYTLLIDWAITWSLVFFSCLSRLLFEYLNEWHGYLMVLEMHKTLNFLVNVKSTIFEILCIFYLI